MHPKANYAAQANYTDAVPQSTPEVGMYDEMCALRNRLSTLNSQLESAIHRIYGPRPQVATGGTGSNEKNQEQPSLRTVSLQVGRELQYAEQQIAEITNFIG